MPFSFFFSITDKMYVVDPEFNDLLGYSLILKLEAYV